MTAPSYIRKNVVNIILELFIMRYTVKFCEYGVYEKSGREKFVRNSVCAVWAFAASFALIKYWLRSAQPSSILLLHPPCYLSVVLLMLNMRVRRQAPHSHHPLQWISLLFAVFVFRNRKPAAAAKRQILLKFRLKQSEIVRLTLDWTSGVKTPWNSNQ